MTIDDVVTKFNATPFLFVGSGLTRRYYNLPDWRGLLEHFANIISDDEFSYSSYENKASTMVYKAGIMPKVAELIQKDYDEKWFSNKAIRTVDDEIREEIKGGLSPFKAEVAAYIERYSILDKKYCNEVKKLSLISEKSISGVITTNYDCFMEKYLLGFKQYIGQSQLIFSAIQGIAEIYKIHGSIEKPDSIIINETDYLQFEKKSGYLAAKLMTIFMEYPIVFLGYSLSDMNIQNIISSIVNCLDDKQLQLLQDRFVFVEYKKDKIGADVTPYTIMIDGKPLTMTRIVLSDFTLLYNAMENKRTKLPVRLLRRFKQELYDYTITNNATANMRVASIEDDRIKDDEFVLAIGKYSDFGLKGLSGIESNEWYRDIVMDDLDFSADDLLDYAAPKLLKQNSGRLPVNKYVAQATKRFPQYEELARKQDFDNIISRTIKNNRKCLGNYESVQQIWQQEKDSIEKATRLMAHLEEQKIDVDELEKILRKLFEEDINILQNVTATARTNIRRLIMVYDYLKWGK
ncbi:MAG: SIR2 family protein [Lachnospiraceae bacterium]|nr:SIR2 family protein [Lachnospiraceae bacterium]MDE6627239.1 SIR2 family protein [Lachnospiraceae bacterium]